MARISKVLSFSHTEENGDKVSEVTVDPGGGANTSEIQYSPAGDDSQPLPDDFAVSTPVSGTGVYATIGYIDRKNDQKAEAGDKRIYARDSGGVSKVELWLKGDGSAILSNDNGTVELKEDGSAILSNDNGSLELKENGEVEANGATIDTTGDVTTPEGVSLRTHTHNVTAVGSPTGPPIPT